MYNIVVAKYDNGRERYLLINSNYDIEEALLVYMNYLEANYSINTIYSYLIDIKQFLNYLLEKNIEFDDVKPFIIASYVRYLQGREQHNIKLTNKIKNTTINKKLSVIGKFYECISGYVKMNNIINFFYKDSLKPMNMYKSFLHHAGLYKNRTKKLTHGVKRLRNDALRDSNKFISRNNIDIFRENLKYDRDKLILDILYNTGMRIGEVLNLKVFDISEIGSDGWGYITIIERDNTEYDGIKDAESRQTKSGGRKVTVHNELIEKIERYILNDRPYVEGVEFIFVSNRRNKGKPIKRGSIEKQFRKTSKITGIKITPHYMRHTHITELTEADVSVYNISKRVGHSIQNTTEKYTHTSLEYDAEKYMQFIKEKGKK